MNWRANEWGSNLVYSNRLWKEFCKANYCTLNFTGQYMWWNQVHNVLICAVRHPCMLNDCQDSRIALSSSLFGDIFMTDTYIGARDCSMIMWSVFGIFNRKTSRLTYSLALDSPLHYIVNLKERSVKFFISHSLAIRLFFHSCVIGICIFISLPNGELSNMQSVCLNSTLDLLWLC